jgi:uncharacterized repeat protein (TIGR02543 family)
VATTITAASDSGYTFSGWAVTSGSATIADSNSASTTITLESGDAAVTASWTPNECTITINNPSYPTFSMSPISFTLQSGGGTTQETITVEPGSGVTISSYEWFVNGISRLKGGLHDSLTLNTETNTDWFEWGENTLTLVVIINGVPYSDRFFFTVEQY